MKLNDIAIRKFKLPEKPKKLADGGGLYLEVLPSGSKLWRLKYRFNGKENRLSLGKYPIVTLEMARKKRYEVKSLLFQGITTFISYGNISTYRQGDIIINLGKNSDKDDDKIAKILNLLEGKN